MDDNSRPASPPDAPDKEKMDQIRRRRLEKLGGGPLSLKRDASSASSSGQSPSGSTTPAPQTQTSSSDVPSTVPSTNAAPSSSQQTMLENPFLKLETQESETPKPISITINPAENSSKRPRPGDAVTEPPLRKPAVTPREESIEAFENRILTNIFRLTLDEGQKTDSNGHKLVFLPNLKEELNEAGEPLKLSVGVLDSAILEAASKIPKNKPILDYLLPCWKRIVRTMRKERGLSAKKVTFLKEAKRLCMSNCIFAVTVPELYGREPNAHTDSLVPYFLNDSEDERGVCHDFITEAVSRFDEDESVKPIFTKAVAGLSYQLSNLTMNDNYKPHVHALKTLTRFKDIATAIAEDPLFQMATSAPGIEKHTILGPFFRISPLQPEVTKSYFSGPKTMDKRQVQSSQSALRMTLNTHQKDLLDIINQLVRASTTARNRTLDWFAYVVNENHKRRAIQVDEKAVSTDGFMMNVTVVLDCLCEPFMDTTYSKVSKIDIEYLRRSPRVQIKDETKLNADQKTSDQFYETKLEGSSNFISEIFFLTMAAHHYGSESVNSKMKRLDKDIKYFQKQMAQLETERPKFQGNPVQLAQFELGLKRYNDVLEKAMQLKFAIEGVLFDDSMQARSLQFMKYVIVFLLRLASGADWVPGKEFKLPLPAEESEAFRNLPEYFLEDIIGNFKFIFNYVPQVIISSQTDEIVVLCITFLQNSGYIKNPYLKSGLVALLYHGTLPTYHKSKGILGDALIGDKFATDHLLHALMKVYIEVEVTGAHTQFYDKFNIRYEIFQVVKCIWANTIYLERLLEESKVNTDFFVRYVNLLLNDATFLLDESLTKFPKIHELQVALRNPEALTEEERAAKTEELSSAEGQATSWMQLGNETISMMKLFTGALSEAFTMPEIVQRLADMLDYNLDTLVGPKSSDLKVQDPSKYYFNPKTLLAEFVDIYLNLGQSKRFVEAVARDGRSYKPANFENASRIMQRWALKSKEDLNAWQALIAKFKIAKEIDDQAEEDLGEVPDEFLDPLMFTLMEDPVILPMSKQTIDRSTIRSHLLSDPTDPFNRQPMSIEDVVPDLEIKEKIRLFKEERKALAKQALEDRMDVAEG